MPRMRLWHPESPGVHVTVDVRWYRVNSALKWGFATLGECLREDKRRNKIRKLTEHGEIPAWSVR